MADLPEIAEWTTGIYQLETSDPVLGGPEGIDNLQGKQLANRTAYLKQHIGALESGDTASGKASVLATARTISLTGDGTWSVSFDGSGNVSAGFTLSNIGVVAGTYGKVTVNAKGLVTAGSSLAAGDIPLLDWSKITTGRPTTLDGYGIGLPSQLQAETGTDNTLPMTPLRVFQAIAKVITQATEGAFGWLKIATQSQVVAGTDDTAAVTSKKLRAGFVLYWSAPTGAGYIALPTWLGGYIIQTGQVNSAVDDVITILPTAFPNTFMQVMVCNGYTAGSGSIGYLAASARDASSIVSRGSSASLGARYIAIGK
ncbi:hypothetical protein [Pseudomonas sp. ACM7]|uniref:gp53-like domain-containing protein n=1 Tax=Pseudomonas sp. ACM7 TaxID=2052956 RepID=UPI0010101C44|nr:hypothetical protein [Pseudomonas sp. ACM7]QAY92568.1 hypothetical protein CUN63_22840 [Pseudomonas sp. ACM7]